MSCFVTFAFAAMSLVVQLPHFSDAAVVAELGWTPLPYAETNADQFPVGLDSRLLIKSGDPLTANSGYTFRRQPDYNFFLPDKDGGGWLFVNHELADKDSSDDFPAIGAENNSGGVSRLTLSPSLQVTESSMHIWQTDYNCSGGPTDWGTFLSCEENPDTGGKKGPDETGLYAGDGYVWEIDPHKPGGKFRVDAMGRFSHEASELDGDGNFYLTDDFTPGLVFKFEPAEKGTLQKGGKLFALDAVARKWIPITDVERARSEGIKNGATRFQRPEGIAWNPKEPQNMYFAVTGGDDFYDQPWGRYPFGAILRLNLKTLELTEVLKGEPQLKEGVHGQMQWPDNIRFDERGMLYICEDHENLNLLSGKGGGAGPNHGRNEVLAWTGNGLYRFAIMGADKGEWTGPFFAKTGQGKTFFVTNQPPGRIYAITGLR